MTIFEKYENATYPRGNKIRHFWKKVFSEGYFAFTELRSTSVWGLIAYPMEKDLLGKQSKKWLGSRNTQKSDVQVTMCPLNCDLSQSKFLQKV